MWWKKSALSPSNLHRILTGRRYAGGQETAKTRSEDMGEKYMKVAAIPAEGGKGKGKGKSSSESANTGTSKGGTKDMVTKVQPKIIPLPFMTETPAEGTRGAKRRKKDQKDKE